MNDNNSLEQIAASEANVLYPCVCDIASRLTLDETCPSSA